MKCPVCDNVNTSRVCIRCGFDSSRDYENYPTFGAVGKAPSTSGLRKRWQTNQKTPFWLIAALCALSMVLGIAIGAGIHKPVPTEPGESMQMQESAETTVPPETTESPDPWETNILRSDKIPDSDGRGGYGINEAERFSVFGSDYWRKQITSVTFLDTLADAPADAWDVSEAGDGKVLAWVKKSGARYDLLIGAEGGIRAGASCEDLFAGYTNVKSITFAEAFHTEYTQDMRRMFFACESLPKLTLGDHFITSNVLDMHAMFYLCNTLTELSLGDRFDTSNVQDMGFMFSNCWSLQKLTLGSHFDTSNVLDMRAMFYYCNTLTELSLGDRFDTSNVKDMSAMFQECKSLKELTLGSHFDTSNVKDMSAMFQWCESLTELTLGDHFITSKVHDMSSMFSHCISLPKLTLGSHFDTSNVKDMRLMFSRCPSLTDLTLGDHFDTTNADTSLMFEYCPAGDDYQHLVH